ncbi:PEP/pyruvate-binding domain-containing protein [Desulfocurvibacter africanus]|uniref:Phosphoenolpyruvate synthase n=1 Tax=Desulfocurvibacter africanus subsp. africanus str. Walvis Bay TaxID=690850 RepID=F3YXA8_DESAF|nr:PEP/pyruvate-binding domain-containing protein [Desulfocurvibacter africanus]EGJ50606.1 Pyruvate, water dikinase [Desulfocurvibacter africanus subsp. africanus str. Walvis Bay]
MLGQLFRHWTYQLFAPGALLRERYDSFRRLLEDDKRCLELITALEEIRYGQVQADWAKLESLLRALTWSVGSLARHLVAMNPGQYMDLEPSLRDLLARLEPLARLPTPYAGPPYVLPLEQVVGARDQAGGKAWHLGRVLVDVGLPVPQGFVVTTSAFFAFLEHNDLAPRLDELLSRVRLDEPERLDALCAEMQDMVLGGALPPAVEQALSEAVAGLTAGGAAPRLAVRSSAVGEDASEIACGGDDSGVSFAGQYESELGVVPADVRQAWLRVLASKYAPRAVAYRVRYGLADREAPMAVLVLAMVQSKSSGVVYSLDPVAEGRRERIGIYAVPGLGERLVGGSSVPDMFYLSRTDNPVLLKSVAQRRVQEGVPGRSTAVLDLPSIKTLADWAMVLERIFGCPQDVEWCQDDEGEMYVIQSRPLQAASAFGERAQPQADEGGRAQAADFAESAEEFAEGLAKGHAVLFRGGLMAAGGVALGRVHLLRDDEPLRSVPGGTVLVCGTLSPDLVSLLGRVKAVVAERGSRASHFASVAREFGLPVLVGAVGARTMLRPGQAVTVDAESRVIYEGSVEGLREAAQSRAPRRSSPMARRLEAIMPLVSPLALTDPQSPRFTPRFCSSLHDIVRFCHEKGVAEMFSLVDRGGRGLARAKRLRTGVPMDFYVLDLHGGTRAKASGKAEIGPSDLASRPMLALWQGLTHQDVVWAKGLKHLDWEAFDQVSAGVGVLGSKELASYAVLSDDYLHAMVRFGYHFAVVDALCCEREDANYVAFRFKGGGADFEHRLLRLAFIAEVLQRAGFVSTSRSDLLDARYSRQDEQKCLQRLTLLGIILGQTRLMDMAMTGQTQVEAMVEEFWKRYGTDMNAL